MIPTIPQQVDQKSHKVMMAKLLIAEVLSAKKETINCALIGGLDSAEAIRVAEVVHGPLMKAALAKLEEAEKWEPAKPAEKKWWRFWE